MAAPGDPHGLSGAGKFLMIWFSVLFGWEVIAPYFLHVGTVIGDANTKAVLANLCIAIMAYLLGRNEGSRQADSTISKLVESNKKAQDVIAAAVPADPASTIKLEPGQAAVAPLGENNGQEEETRPG